MAGKWSENLHPRDDHGRFGHGHGGNLTNEVTTSSGHTVAISRGVGKSQTWQVGSTSLTLDEHDSKVLADELGYLTLVPSGVTRTSKAFTVGSSRAIPYKGGPNDDGGPQLGVVERTGKDTFVLRLRPHDNATPEEINNAPGLPVTAREAGRLETASKKFEADERAAAKAAKDAERADNIRAGRSNQTDVARRATGQPLPAETPGPGMPRTVAQEDVALTGGGTLTVHKQPGSDVVHVTDGDRSFALTSEEVHGINSAIDMADDDEEWGVGESDRVTDDRGFAYATVTKTGPKAYDVQIDGKPGFTLSPKDADRLNASTTRIDAASRAETGNAPTDFLPGPRNSVTLRTPGDDGRPVDVPLTASAASKVLRALNTVNEGFDDDNPDGPDHGVHRVDVPIGGGRKAVVEQIGPVSGPGATGRTVIEADDGSWSVTVNASAYDDWVDAFNQAADAGE